jgi:hypothetical protein
VGRDASEVTDEDLVSEVTTYQAHTTELERQLTEQRMNSVRLVQFEGSGNTHIKSTDIPDPDTFDGTHEKLFPLITKLRLNIVGNTNKFSDIQYQVQYVFSFLSGSAYVTKKMHLLANRINFF